MAKKIDKLSALRERVSKIKMSGTAGYLKLKEGLNNIRILPEVGDMDVFFVLVGVHNLTPDGRKREYCPREMTDGAENCPICEAVDTLYKAGDKASKELAKSLKRKRSFWMNAINRSDEEAGPLIFTPGEKIFGQIANIINDPDYGDVTDINEGFDLVVERKGTGMDTEYDVRSRRNPSPLGKQDQVDEWLEKAKDLSPTQLTEDPDEDSDLTEGKTLWFKCYERLATDFDLDNMGVEEDEGEEEEEPAPKAKKISAKTIVTKAKYEEEEDEEDDEPPVRKAARPSRRH